jgi:hypothetical protein
VPVSWFGEGIAVRNLRTAYGVMAYRLRLEGESLTLTVEGDAPPGGFVLPWPYAERPGQARFNGRVIRPRDGGFVLPGAGALTVRRAPH